MADVFRITISKVTQGRARKGVKPEVVEKVVYSQEIDADQYARAVRAINSEVVESSLFDHTTAP
jgi:hypothetical protein